MKPSDALRKCRSEIRDIVARHGALAPRVFGSVVVGTDTEESDLDLLVDPSPRTTLMTLAEIQLDAEHNDLDHRRGPLSLKRRSFRQSDNIYFDQL
jgi:predicted nucleotidyltransferase